MGINNISSKSLARTRAMVLKAVELKRDHQLNLVPQIHGNHGIGKTQMMYQIGKDLDYNVKVLNLANLSPEELLGQLDGKGGYYRPDWFVVDDKPTIYFLDEMNRAPKYVLQGMFNFINEGRIHNYTIKPNDMIVGAVNPSDAYEVSCFDDDAFQSRFLHIKMQPEQKEFTNYLGNVVKNTIVQETLKKTVNIYQDREFDIGFQVTPDNRKLEKVGMLFEILSDEEMGDIGIDLLEGLVGFESASAFLETWRESKKNVHDPKKVLAMEVKDYKFGFEDVDVINTINTKMIAMIKTKDLTKKQKEGFVRYVEFIPKDLGLAFLKDVAQTRDSLIDELSSEWAMRLMNMNDK